MKKLLLILLPLTLLFGCSNPNAEYLSKIKQNLKENANGVELNYENIEFKWVDTLFVSEQITQLNSSYEKKITSIMEIENYVKDNYETGKVFTKSYLTKDRFEELRNWEKNRRKKYSKGDYYEFAFKNREASSWISELCNQIEETDSLLSVYDEINEGNLDLFQNSLWYYEHIDNYVSNGNPSQIWAKVLNELTELRQINLDLEGLLKLEPNKVINYKASNIYKINNPLLNGAEQEVNNTVLFNSELEIIKID
jgi:uncharacterized phage-like protein YoqJ